MWLPINTGRPQDDTEATNKIRDTDKSMELDHMNQNMELIDIIALYYRLGMMHKDILEPFTKFACTK